MALRPVVQLGTGRTVAYEVLARPPREPLDPVPLLQRVLAVMPLVAPAAVVVPVHRDLSPELAVELAELAGGAEVRPSDIVWLLPAPGASLLEASRMVVAQSLAAHGFRVALEGISLAAVARPEVVQLRPWFCFVDRHVVRRLESDQAARATVSGLQAFFARLGGRLVAQGVEDEGALRRLVELGVDLASGHHLGPTVVLDALLAEPGDAVVDRTWLRARPADALGGDAGEPAPLPVATRQDESEAPQPGELVEALSETARRLRGAAGVEGILSVVVEQLPGVVSVDRLAVLEADWSAYRMVQRAVIGVEPDVLADLEESLDSGLTGWAFLRGETYNCPDTFAHDESVHLPLDAPGRVEESLVVLPLVVGDHRLGVLDVWRDGTDAFSETDVQVLELFAFLAATAWRDAQLTAALDERTIVDALTGLRNMRAFEELARREAAQAVRDGTGVAVLLVDLDHFGRINESLGEAVGDVVLANAARALAGVVRTGDAALRFGGDEFLVLLHRGDERAARRVAGGLGEALAALPSPSDELGALSASVGIALFPEHGETFDEVVEAAGAALAVARGRGRAEIEVFTGPG